MVGGGVPGASEALLRALGPIMCSAKLLGQSEDSKPCLNLITAIKVLLHPIFFHSHTNINNIILRKGFLSLCSTFICSLNKKRCPESLCISCCSWGTWKPSCCKNECINSCTTNVVREVSLWFDVAFAWLSFHALHSALNMKRKEIFLLFPSHKCVCLSREGQESFWM